MRGATLMPSLGPPRAGRNLLTRHRNAEAVQCIAVARELTRGNGYDAIKADLDGRMAIALTRCGPRPKRPAGRGLPAPQAPTGEPASSKIYSQAGYAEALLRLGGGRARSGGAGEVWRLRAASTIRA